MNQVVCPWPKLFQSVYLSWKACFSIVRLLFCQRIAFNIMRIRAKWALITILVCSSNICKVWSSVVSTQVIRNSIRPALRSTKYCRWRHSHRTFQALTRPLAITKWDLLLKKCAFTYSLPTRNITYEWAGLNANYFHAFVWQTLEEVHADNGGQYSLVQLFTTYVNFMSPFYYLNIVAVVIIEAEQNLKRSASLLSRRLVGPLGLYPLCRRSNPWALFISLFDHYW